eukprot:4790646-Amphidinium_carterae.3
MIVALPNAVVGADACLNPGMMDTLSRTAGGLKSEQWGGEAEADDGMRMGVATLAMPATSASRTWIIDTEAAQHLIGKSYLSRDEIQSIYTFAPVSLTTANDVVRTSSRVEIEMGCLGGLKCRVVGCCWFRLTWTPETLELALPNGCKTTLRSRGDVPGIVESNATALTAHANQQVSFSVDGEILTSSD